MAREEVEVFGPNVHIDTCPLCRGTWLDKGELAKVITDRDLAKVVEASTNETSELRCPRCAGPMSIGRTRDVEVDVCQSCGGVWLDTWELHDLRSISEKGLMRGREGRHRKMEASFFTFMRNFPR
jgi:Zn-finger nucleic acid-binding protein